MHTSCSCGVCPSCIESLALSCENGAVGTVNRGAYSRVSDRNGNPKNLRNKENSVLVSDGNSAEMHDGSEGSPIPLNLQELSQASSVVASTTDGLIGRMTPDVGDETLWFGKKHGVIGFWPEGSNPLVIQSSKVVAGSKGTFAIFVCKDGGGFYELARFSPGCEGRRHLVIEGDEISCDDKEVDDCEPNISDVTSFDSFLACNDGKKVNVLASEGNEIVRNATTNKWEVRSRGTVGFATPRYFIGQNRAGYTAGPSIPGLIDIPGVSGTTSGTFNMSSISNYVKGASIVSLRWIGMVNTIASFQEASVQFKFNGVVCAELWIDTNGSFGYGKEGLYPVQLAQAGDPNSDQSFTFEILVYAFSSTAQAWGKLEVVNWA